MPVRWRSGSAIAAGGTRPLTGFELGSYLLLQALDALFKLVDCREQPQIRLFDRSALSLARIARAQRGISRTGTKPERRWQTG